MQLRFTEYSLIFFQPCATCKRSRAASWFIDDGQSLRDSNLAARQVLRNCDFTRIMSSQMWIVDPNQGLSDDWVTIAVWKLIVDVDSTSFSAAYFNMGGFNMFEPTRICLFCSIPILRKIVVAASGWEGSKSPSLLFVGHGPCIWCPCSTGCKDGWTFHFRDDPRSWSN